MPYKMPFKYLLNPGHSACAGCGELLAMRHVLQAAGEKTIIANATGCSEVTTSRYPFSSFKVPWIHANFENAICLAAGAYYALKQQGKEKEVNIIAWGGDGATIDIGMGQISGSWERQENILYVCFDNEAYMNTGVQASGSTPLDANTTTSPPGSASNGNYLKKKDMIGIALAHGCVYAATATVGNVMDIENKVKKALSLTGPKYLQILVTCVPGWYTESKDTIKVARLAQQTGIYPVVEYVNGQLVSAAKTPNPRPKVQEYLSLQGRYKHLFKPEENKEEIARIQALADANVFGRENFAFLNLL
ncbi:MAG: Pyruvate ferredoxin oxidoreductase beta subunit [Parcubacteria group bacterium GW2011_GWA2_40_23]|nr:MAG: Pyruvate ferredoxin oxidoreductase beta subunit [Parcubacteria group bacterium GW2011_GWA2_40_23]